MKRKRSISLTWRSFQNSINKGGIGIQTSGGETWAFIGEKIGFVKRKTYGGTKTRDKRFKRKRERGEKFLSIYSIHTHLAPRGTHRPSIKALHTH